MMDLSSLQNKVTLSVIGRSGSGKGTQARLLLKQFEPETVHHMETGRFLRGLLTNENPTTEIARQLIMEKGKIFPEWFAVFTWLRELIEGGHANQHLVFDGAPRRLAEAKLLDEVIQWHSRPLPVAIHVEVSEEETMRRLLARGRADDTPEVIRNRLEYFPKDVMPVIEYYQKNNRLITVNGELEPEAVSQHIITELKKQFGPLWPHS